MPHVELVRHPSSSADATRAITADVRRARGDLVFGFVLDGDLDAVRIPRRTAGGRADRLWEHTCFEAFVGPEDDPEYLELNLSPSGEWATYAFADYRRRIDAGTAEPTVVVAGAGGGLSITAEWPLPIAYRSRTLCVGLSAVVEQRDGSLAYWALRHTAPAPDFHRRDAFSVRLAP